jgi:hypothetical protein
MKTRKNKKVIKHKIIGGNNDKCIFVDLIGGLGNQIFAYAAAVLTKRKINLPICLIKNYNNPHSTIDYPSKIFKQGTVYSNTDLKTRLNSSQLIFKNISNAYNKFKTNNIVFNTNKNIHLKTGHYQNYESIQPVIPELRVEFKQIFEKMYPVLKDEFNQKNNLNKTLSEVSSFMHVRRGDYGDHALPSKYYQDALDVLHQNKILTHLYILSNDIDWCKNQKWNTYSLEVQWVTNNDELYLMYLMTLCIGGAIISHSSFSLFSVILGADNYNTSTIIYPSKWYLGNSNKLSFPSRWTKIVV